MSKKLFVGGIPWSLTSEALGSFFAQYGTVVEAKVVQDAQTGRSRGFGFVSYGSEDEAKAALAADGQSVEGRNIRVELASERPAGGGGGGGRDRGGSGGGRSRGY